MSFRILLFQKATFVTLILLSGQLSYAQEGHSGYLSALSSDPLRRSEISKTVRVSPGTYKDSVSVSVNSAAAANISKEQHKLLDYLKDLGLPEQKQRSNKKFYYHMANVFARLKLYPLAMKCFFKAARLNETRIDPADEADQSLSSIYQNEPGHVSADDNNNNKIVGDKVNERRVIDADESNRKMIYTEANDLTGNNSADSTNNLRYRALQVSSKDDAIVETTALMLRSKAGNKRKQKTKKSQRTSFPQILSNFNDGKTAVAYALLFHVKQPAPGKRKIFVGVNTGHTFITLIKYNTDSSYVSTSFGFYPDKDQLLSATPLAPTTSATFKDDTGHLWDEVLGKFISRRNFENILELTQKFEGMTYNLNKQNCTDFGLQAASLAGIQINDTFGKWPGGRGNNPAVTGQSILSGKIGKDGNTREEELFMDQTVIKEPF